MANCCWPRYEEEKSTTFPFAVLFPFRCGATRWLPGCAHKYSRRQMLDILILAYEWNTSFMRDSKKIRQSSPRICDATRKLRYRAEKQTQTLQKEISLTVRYEFLSNAVRYLSMTERLGASDLELLRTVRSVVAQMKWQYQEHFPGLF